MRLVLNVKKTKEFIVDFRRSDSVHESIVIKVEVVERVSDYKYLGVIFDENLDWIKNSKKVQNKYTKECISCIKCQNIKLTPEF